MRIRKVSQSPIPATSEAQIIDGYSTSTTDGYSANYINSIINQKIQDLQNSLTWKLATYNEGTRFGTVPIAWDDLKEISIRCLGNDSASFEYLTIPKEQWLNNGIYDLSIPCFNAFGTYVGGATIHVTTKNASSFIFSVTPNGNAPGALQFYYG